MSCPKWYIIDIEVEGLIFCNLLGKDKSLLRGQIHVLKLFLK